MLPEGKWHHAAAGDRRSPAGSWIKAPTGSWSSACCPRELSLEAFTYLDGEHQDALAGELTSEGNAPVTGGYEPDDRTQFLAELPGQVTQRLLNYLSPADLIQARQLLRVP